MKHQKATHRVAALFALASVATVPASAFVYQDDFDDGIVNPALWALDQVGGPTIAETGGAMTLTIPANSFGAHFYSAAIGVPNLVGDYDARVDYFLDQWPAANGIRVGMSIGGTSMERLNFDQFHPEWYLFEYNVNQWFTRETADRSGSLRLTRVGATVTGSIFVNGAWEVLGNWTPAPTEDVPFRIWAWSHDPFFGHSDAAVRFDNFYAVDSAVPEPAAFAVLGLGLGALVRRRR